VFAAKVAKARTKAANVSTERSRLGRSSVIEQRSGDPGERARASSCNFGETPVCSRARSPNAPRSIQTKLAVNTPGERFEREADDIAERVMGLPAPRAQRVQVQSHDASTRTDAPTELVDEALRSPGQPLDGATHAFMAGRFGSDFSRVRVHSDPLAARSASALSARAYTVGNHVVFGTGEWAPGTRSGQRLLAHELVHVMQQQRSAVAVQRQHTGGGTATAQEDFVRETIRFLENSADFYGQVARVDAAMFNRVIDSWYSMVIRQGELIDTDLHGNAALKAQLHTAYISALRVLVTKHAATSGQTEEDLYRINSGRIPDWAQPHPTHQVAGITTPIPDDVTTTTTRRGRVDFNLNGFDVQVSPDTRVRRQATTGLTSHHITWGGVSARLRRTRAGTTVVSVTGPPTPLVTLATTYLRGADITASSAYGRGNTAEDRAGAAVTPGSGSVAFHESRHSQAVLDFLRNNPPPTFTGRVGDSAADFNTALAQWRTDVQDYARRMEQADTAQVHCVGFTVDDFNTANPQRGRRIVRECP